MTKSERLELIEKYRKGRMEGFELQRFEDLLESNEVLRKELALDIEMSEALNDKSDYNLFKKSLQKAEQKYFNQQPESRTLYWRAAAAVGLLIVATMLIWKPFSTPTPDQRFASAFEPYQAPTNFRGTDLATMDDDFMMGLVKYEDGQYAEAIRLFTLTLEKDAVNYTAKFLLGISHMALKEFDKAEPVLKEMVDDTSHLFQDQARWYLGLLYLVDEEERNDENSKSYFDQIENQQLLERIRSLK